VSDVEPFCVSEFSGYEPSGRRGIGYSFEISENMPEMYTLSLPVGKGNPTAVEAPVYVHEVHLLFEEVSSDLCELESSCRSAVQSIFGSLETVWSVALVDLYRCPQTKQISHVIQIAYCSVQAAISRGLADSFREAIEKRICGISYVLYYLYIYTHSYFIDYRLCSHIFSEILSSEKTLSVSIRKSSGRGL
jgi:hypothetical protein